MTERAPSRIGRFLHSERFHSVLEALRTGGLSLLIEKPKTYPQMLEGIGLFEDPQTRKIYQIVQRGLAVFDQDIFRELKTANPPQEVSFSDIETPLSQLAEKGFVLRHKATGGIPWSSPTAKGVRVFKAISSI